MWKGRSYCVILLILALVQLNFYDLCSQSIIYEAENAELTGSNSVGSQYSGYSGSGYVGGFVEDGSSVKFRVIVTKTGSYELYVGYMSLFGHKENYLLVNGVQLPDPLIFPGSTVFTETKYGAVNLQAGENIIEIVKWWGYCWVDYIKVGGVGPVAKISQIPTLPVAGKDFTISADGSYHPNGDSIVSYNWLINNRDVFNTKEFTYNIDHTGRFPVQLILTDENGNTTKVAQNILIITGMPHASFSMSPAIVEPGMEVAFNANGSVDYNGEIQSYDWNFGDGRVASGKHVSQLFAQEGNYPVTLTITDADGNRVSTTSWLFVYPPSEKIRGLQWEKEEVGLYEKAELYFHVYEDYTNVYDPDEVKVDAIITTETKSNIVVPCFHFTKSFYNDTTWKLDPSNEYWMLRYSPRETGNHEVIIRVTDKAGTIYSRKVSFIGISSDSKGFIHIDKAGDGYYRHESGEPYYPLGMHLQGSEDMIKHPLWQVEKMNEHNANFIRQWLVGNTQLEGIGVRWKGLGYYSQESAAMVDTLLNMFRDNGVYMQMVFNWHGQFSENVNTNWEWNPYNVKNGGFLEKPADYFNNQRAYHQAKKHIRYIIARWGYSPNVFAWEFFNEVNFTGHFLHEPATFKYDIDTYHDSMSVYLESIDAFDHIQTTSSDHEQLVLMNDNKAMDLLQFHVYSDNLLAAIRHEAASLHNDLTKPVICGEFGTPSTKDLLRKVFWQGLFIQAPSQYWYVETLVKNDWWDAFSALGRFTEGINFAAEAVKMDTMNYSGSEGLEFLTLAGPKSIYGYLYHPENKTSISGVRVQLEGLDFGYYRLEFVHPETGVFIEADSIAVINTTIELLLPVFSKEIAFRLRFSSEYLSPLAVAGEDQKVQFPMEIYVDGGRSYDPMGNRLNFKWQLVSKPEGSKVELPDINDSKFSFVPDESGIYTFELKVDNGMETGLPDTIHILSSRKPVAVISADTLEVLVGKYLQPDGLGSNDVENEKLNYSWTLLSKPPGSNPQLYKTTESKMAFRSYDSGEYLVSLVVHDGISASDPDTIVIRVVDDITSSLEELSQDDRIVVFPNPFSERLFIRITDREFVDLKVDLVDCLGRVRTIHDGAACEGLNEIVIIPEEYAMHPGLYFLRVAIEDNIEEFKIVFQK